MITRLRVLHLEDRWQDAELIQAQLEAEGFTCDVHRIETRAEFEAALAGGGYDLILSDYSLPTFDGLAALAISREQQPDVPFIFITGTLGETIAVETLQRGATDYIIKDRLTRLPAAVRRALSEGEERTQRRRTETLLAESERRFRALIENSSDGLFLVDIQGTVVYAAPSTAHILGYAADELTGQDIFALVHPDDLELSRRSFAEIGNRPGKPVPAQVRYRHRTGSWRWVDGLGNNLLDVPGVQAIVLNFRDITEQRSLEEQLRQAQKMEAVGRLAGGIAHDFNNLLTIISGYSELLLSRTTVSPESRSYLTEIDEAAERAAALTQQLLAFSRRQMLQPRVLDVNTVVQDTERLLRRLIGEDIELTTALEPELSPIRTDEGQLQQVLLNLAVNARDAMSKGGKLKIETANVALDDHDARSLPGVQPGDHVMIAVTDTGTGMDAATQSHIFEPFFTTKEQGTGLGLSTVYGIVQQSGGGIGVQSAPRRGTTFRVYFPQARDAVPENLQPDEIRQESPGGNETILLVEDEDRVRAFLRNVLKPQGYNLLECRNGGDALAQMQAHHGPIQLVLTDVVMPGMDGRQLAAAVRTVHPEARVLFMSGYTDDAIIHHGVGVQHITFLGKPFSASDVLQKVRAILDAPPVAAEQSPAQSLDTSSTPE